MSKHWKRPKRVDMRADRAGAKPARHDGRGGRTVKSTENPTHSLFRDDCPAAVYSGTMDLCYVELSRRMPGYSTDYLLTVGGWTIKRIQEPTEPTEPAGALPGHSGPSEVRSSTDGPARGLPGPTGETPE